MIDEAWHMTELMGINHTKIDKMHWDILQCIFYVTAILTEVVINLSLDSNAWYVRAAPF